MQPLRRRLSSLPAPSIRWGVFEHPYTKCSAIQTDALRERLDEQRDVRADLAHSIDARERTIADEGQCKISIALEPPDRQHPELAVAR
ncbi:MAG: hypothetical protein ACKV2T_42785 [Kofleriaceae bacterium]